jgi:myo-inositol-1-phosphate synthase
VWIFGARGGLATTLITGARAIARGLAGTQGLLTETPLCADLPLAPIGGLVFGGHEVRRGTLLDSAREIREGTGAIPHLLLEKIAPDLARIDRAVRDGCLVNAGRTIRNLPDIKPLREAPLRAELARIERDVKAFIQREKLASCVCVNLTSTEPQLRLGRAHASLGALERAIDGDRRSAVRPSTIYALVAARLGLPFIHFTPSNAALVPAVREAFEQSGAPYMGADGKTGETLVKSALAPMFKYRNLQVLSWQGYNILGDRDGAVLADEENKRSKVESKDALLAAILGYPLHTHVGIDYVPSLNDLKTAWDFVHFKGFLDYKMSLQFTWQGCDAVLAAPLVLDMVRFADLAQRRGEHGPMRHLSCFFKRPVDVAEHDLHLQWHLLTDYVRAAART